ncbi:MAG TPA: response regulator transcription factor, partial [Sorangium sp.]|nr:response regulator transcription factor [Sorangium sp.]
LDFSLKRAGYTTRLAATGQRALDALDEQLPDLVLLDLMLPDMSGNDVCRRLRSQPRTRAVPVMMLTAKAAEIDRVVGFEVGTDDYVTKPFSMRELLLRIRALLRRAQPSEPASQQLTLGPVQLDVAAHRCRVDNREVKLTALEFRLLTTLMKRRGRVQTRDVLLTDVWGLSSNVTTRTVDTHVKRLRQKIGSAGHYIETLRGVGYRMSDPSSEANH